jgi:hypothetical protein
LGKLPLCNKLAKVVEKFIIIFSTTKTMTKNNGRNKGKPFPSYFNQN